MANSATVYHVTKDHIVIRPGKGFSVTVFTLGNVGRDLEAFVTAEDGSETIRLLVAGPRAEQTMSIVTDDDGTVNVFYTEKPDDRY